MSKAILGGTLTTSAESTGLGSNLGETHNECRKEIRISDARQIGKTLEVQFLRAIVALNSNAKRAPRWVWDLEEADDLKTFADALPDLVDIGVKIPEAWAHERLKIPTPKDGEAVLERRAPVLGLARQTFLAAARSRLPRPAADAVPAQQARVEREGDRLIEGLIDQVREVVMTATDFGDLQRRLVELYPDLDDGEFAALLGDAMAAAHLAGRHDIIEGV